MLHVPAKFQENTSMRFRVTVRKLNVTDGQGALQYLPSRAFSAAEDNYTAYPHDMVHIPEKFRENTAMLFWVTVRKLNVTDRQTDGQTDGQGALQYLPSRVFGAVGDKIISYLQLQLDIYSSCFNKTAVVAVILDIFSFQIFLSLLDKYKILFYFIFSKWSAGYIHVYIFTLILCGNFKYFPLLGIFNLCIQPFLEIAWPCACLFYTFCLYLQLGHIYNFTTSSYLNLLTSINTFIWVHNYNLT